MTNRYFYYNGEGDFEFFETAEEARKAAEEAVDWHRDNASEGWPEATDNVCWGEIRERATLTKEVPLEDLDEDERASIEDAGCTHLADYGLVSVGDSGADERAAIVRYLRECAAFHAAHETPQHDLRARVLTYHARQIEEGARAFTDQCAAGGE